MGVWAGEAMKLPEFSVMPTSKHIYAIFSKGLGIPQVDV
jgi:hypothetical protein